MKDTDVLLAEQIAYCRATAAEYYVDEVAARDLAAALDEFGASGRRVRASLWSGRLDAAAASTRGHRHWLGRCSGDDGPARARVGGGRVRFIQASLFAGHPRSSMIPSFSVSGCRTFHSIGSTHFGPSYESV